MRNVSESLRVYCCLLLACNLFVSLIGIWPGNLTWVESFYYRSGTALIVISAFLLWKFLVKPERRNQLVFWLIAFVWTTLNLIWIGKSASAG